MAGIISSLSSTILAGAPGAGIGSAIDVSRSSVVGVIIPAAWTAAGLGWLVSYDDGDTYVQLMRIGQPTTATDPQPLGEWEILAANMPTAESVQIPLNPADFLGVTHMKPKSQTAGSAVNQGSDRVVKVVVRDIGA